MSTIHNPVNFKPEDYYVVDYIDNQPPKYCGGPVGGYAEEMKRWRASIAFLNVQGGIHKCCHCGNGNVRYVAICLHKPSGRNVCFGSDCVERLNFENASAFKAQMIRNAANTRAESLRRFVRVRQVLQDTPGLADAFEAGRKFNNSFVQDVERRLNQYGSLSDAQISAVIRAAERDAKRDEEKRNAPPAGPLPTGKRIEVTGEVVHVRQQDGLYGIQWKMLVKLANGSKLWSTCPESLFNAAGSEPKGWIVTIRATIEASKEDATFGFANRPHLVKAEPKKVDDSTCAPTAV